MNYMSQTVDFIHTPSATALDHFFYVLYIGHLVCKLNHRFERDSFGSYLLVATVSGKGHLIYRDKHYEVTDCMLIDCDDYHLFHADPDCGWEYKWMHFNGCSSKGYFEMIYDKAGPVFRLDNMAYVYDWIDNLMDQIKDNNMDFEINASASILNVLSYILVSNKLFKFADTKAINKSVKVVIDYIEKNYANEINHAQLAKIAGYSECYLYKIFKSATGYRPHEYLIKYRINKAKYLLKSSDLSVEHISESVGYSNASNFITIFKKLEGVTPLQYRNR